MNPYLHFLPLLLLTGAPAFGMCISTTYTPLAWTHDGQGVIIREQATGPEGGGSISYVVISFHKETAAR